MLRYECTISDETTKLAIPAAGLITDNQLTS